jgi:hypothetical protein
MWICGLDQPNLLVPLPALDLSLAIERTAGARCFLVKDKPIDVVPACKAGHLIKTVLMHPSKKIPGYAGV